MNFVTQIRVFERLLSARALLNLFISILLSIHLVGCGDQVRPPSAGQLYEFMNAGPARPTVDMDRLVEAKLRMGPYSAVAGDVLQVTMPAMLQVMTAEVPSTTETFTPYVCRVAESGVVTLPIVGEIEAAGKTLAQIESAIVDAYHPEYIVQRPSVLARVAEYRTAKVAITGAVQNPGAYELRSDQMSLVNLLMLAGGIVDEGAARISIRHSHETTPAGNEPSTSQIAESIEGALYRTRQHAVQQQVEQPAPARPNDGRMVQSPVVSSRSDDADVQLSFLQTAPPGTIGQLTIKQDDRTLLIEQLDITSDIQVRGMLEKLAQTAPDVSTPQVGQKIRVLAKILRGSFVNGNIENAGIVTYRNFATQLNVGISQRITNSGDTSHSDMPTVLELQETLAVLEQANTGRPKDSDSIMLPVKGLNIPFVDVPLQEGDRVQVERLEPSLFTVVGLVASPGNFPYPSGAQYNLMHALAFAGGLDKAAEPRYATVYRLKIDGTIASVPFKVVEDDKLTVAINIPIKPGDIVDVAHTPRTRTNLFLQGLFRLQVGAYVPIFDQNR